MKQLRLVLLLLALSLIAGCGSSSSETPLQKAEAEYKEINAELKDLEKSSEKKSNEALKASSESLKLLKIQQDAAASGDLETVRELEEEAKEAQAKSEQLYRESNQANGAPEELRARNAKLVAKIEGLKGCDAGCRAAREKAINQNIHCELALGRVVGFERAYATCKERFPIPRENILHLED